MAEKIKVSVILTSYNHEKYLREAINSVLDQTFTDFELIIWDDASTDESWAIIQSYTDLRIRAFRNEINQNGVSNVNRAISEEAKGKYIAIHHSDDAWESQKLQKQLAFLEENPQIGAVFSNALIIGEEGELFEDVSHFYYKIFDQPNRNRHEWLNYFFNHGNALCHPSVLIRKVCYNECGLYRYGLAQLPDFDMWIRLCLKYEIYVMPEKLIRFRVRANEMNTSGNRSDTRIRRYFEILQVLNNYRNIPSIQELIKIFPNAEKYLRPQDHDFGFALGMIAIDSKTNQITELFGLNILFEIINDPDRAKKIRELYDFTQNDFIALTGKYDVFSAELMLTFTHQIAEQEVKIKSLNVKLANRERDLLEIRSSKAWKIAMLLRQIRLFLFPLDSPQTKAVQYLLSIIQRKLLGGRVENAVRRLFRLARKVLFQRISAANYLLDMQSVPPTTSISPGRIGIHAHIFYHDLAPEFARYFKNMPFPYDLFISVPDE